MNDPAKKAIDSIGKPKRRPADDAQKKLDDMTPEELMVRLELRKRYKPNLVDIKRGGE